MQSAKYGDVQTGKLRALVFLFFPILLISFSTYMPLFMEKLFLGRISEQAIEIAVNAAYLSHIVQIPCIALAMMAQVYVGRWFGAQDYKAIGPGIWQLIWFSFLSTLITLPVGWFSGNSYFQGTPLEAEGLPYCHFLIAINFLYPLGAALSCFYLGQGKARTVVIATIGAQLIKLVFAYLLIFGYGSWIPRLELMGGAISTLMAQGSFCLFLFWKFFSSKNNKLFHSRAWYFHPKLFWECVRPGLLRAVNRISSLTAWMLTAALLKAKGGDYLLSFSIGGILFLFLPFLGDAICQAQTTIVSQILGSKSYSFLNKALRSGCVLVAIIIALASIPLVVFPVTTFELLFPTIPLALSSIKSIFFGVWLSFAFFVFGFLPISYILAFKDMKFSLLMGGVCWVTGYLFMYVAIEKMQMGADQFWIFLSVSHASSLAFYWLRMRWLQSRLLASDALVAAKSSLSL